jgi:thermostable 8-oxoguanine DNA glycosylase
MITPNNITNYNRTEDELEEFLLFSILVAGKNAQIQAQKLESFIGQATNLLNISPFDWINHLVQIENEVSSSYSKPLIKCMTAHKLGQYNRLYHAFKGIMQFKGKLKNVTIGELESVKGIGSKTARFFVLHSRPDQKIAVLDTHILKYLHALGYPKIPKATPSKKDYERIEYYFLNEANKEGKTAADLDLQIWKNYSGAKKGNILLEKSLKSA